MATTGLRLNDPRPLVQDKRGFATQQLSSLAHSSSASPNKTIMSSLIGTLGLHANSSHHAPYYLLANFLFAHFILVPRTFKQYHGIDNNAHPRDDLSLYGDAAVKSGKLTQRQLDRIKRAAAAHANRVENYAVFGAAVVSAMVAGVPGQVVNGYCLLYSVSSVAYGVAYVVVERNPWSVLRTLAWWSGGWACVRLFWEAGRALSRK